MLRTVLLIGAIITISLVPYTSRGQHDPDNARDERLTRRLGQIADSTTMVCKKVLATISAETDEAVQREMHAVSLFADSILALSKDSIRTSRLDTLRSALTDIEQELRERWVHLRPDIDELHGVCRRILTSARNDHRMTWPGGSLRDTSDLVDEFSDLADSTLEALRDSAQASSDDALSLWFDLADAAKDSIESLSDLLMEREQEQLDAETAEAEQASRIDVQMAYDSHYSFLGRDNGIRQSAVSPSVTYRHRTGLSMSAGISWMSETQNHWDDVYVAVGYDISFNDNLGCSFGYSRYWFLANSLNPRSVLNNGVSAQMSMETPAIHSELALGMDFGSKSSEWLVTLTVSHPFALGGGRFVTMLTEPTFTANFGEQNQDLVATRKTIGKGKKAVSSTTTTSSTRSVFGIMDYEIQVPLQIHLNSFAVTPSVTWILPLNVLDSGTGDPFWKAEIDLTVTIQ
jgi:hypothetical protein